MGRVYFLTGSDCECTAGEPLALSYVLSHVGNKTFSAGDGVSVTSEQLWPAVGFIL